MSLTVFALIVLCVYTILHFYSIPKLEKQFQSDLSINRIGKNATLSILSILKGVSLMFLIAVLLVMGIMAIISSKGGTTAAEVNDSIAQLQSWKDGVGSWNKALGVFSVIVLISALFIHAYRRSKVKAKSVFDKMYNKEYNKLEKAFEEGTLSKMELTPDLEEDYKNFHEIDFILNNPEKVQFPENADPQRILDELISKGNSIIEKIKSKEINRRIKLTIKKEEAELPKPVTFFDKLQTFFISKGLLNNLGRTNKVFYSLGLLLLIPSMLCVYSTKVKDEATTNIVQLDNLKLSFAKDEANKALENNIAQLNPEEENYELTKEDEDIIDEIAELYESTLVEGFLAKSALNTTARYAFRSNIVKNELLRRFSESSKSTQQLDSGSKVKGVNSREKAVLEFSEDVAVQKKRVELKGHSLKDDLRKAVKKKPSLLQRFNSELKSFQVPVKSKDLSRALVKQTVSSAMPGVIDSDLSSIVDQSIDDFTKRELALLNETQSKKFANKIITGESLDDAVKSVKSSTEFARMESNIRTVIDDIPLDNINNKLRNHPPSLKAVTEPHVNVNRASSRIEKLTQHMDAPRRAAYADALGGLDDYFPAQMGGDAETPRSRLKSKVSPSSRPRVASSGFTRSRSFVKLRGFARVGGVLIGQEEPLNGYDTRYQDLQWNIRGKEIQFILTDDLGKKHVSRYYKIPIAYHALNYASDGRPLAVTMVSAKPMVELKILLHPTLIDSPMGKRVIDLDRFVDQYTGEDSKRGAARKLVYAQQSLYQLAWAVRVNAVVSSFNSSSFSSDQWAFIQQMAAYADEVINSAQIREYAQLALSSNSIHLPEKSVIYAKKDFYDRVIVDELISASKKTNIISSLISDLNLSFKTYYNLSFNEDKIVNVFVQPPEFDLWSGVREQKYTLAPGNLMMLERKQARVPLDFMEQVAFTSVPEFTGREVDLDTYSDDDPWEFPFIKKHLHEKTVRSVLRDDKSAKILNDATEFTYLQRLFRMGLNGYLGDNFPVEKFLDLIEELEAYKPVKYYRTLRWNANASEDDIRYRLLMSGTDEAEIEEILKIRAELGIPVDRKQQIQDLNKPLPSLY